MLAKIFLVLVLDIKALACVVKIFSSSSNNNLGKSVTKTYVIGKEGRKLTVRTYLCLHTGILENAFFLSSFFFCHNILLEVVTG